MLCFVMLCYVMLCYVMLCYVMLCYVMLCYVMLCYVMLCYVMLCYVMLCYVMLCHAMSPFPFLAPVTQAIQIAKFAVFQSPCDHTATMYMLSLRRIKSFVFTRQASH